MEENVNGSILGDGVSNVIVTIETELQDVRTLSISYLMFKIGIVIAKFYFPILVPIGITGNLLSFLVMIQPHNQHMSISYYISALAVTDTIVLLLALMDYLNKVQPLQFTSDHYWSCRVGSALVWASTLSSTLFILSMTFDTVYSIIRPHKAASFNTVKRAKTTILCIVIFSHLYNIPYLFVVTNNGPECVTYLSNIGQQLFIWLSYVIQFIIPFISLLSMNSVIIHTLRTRSQLKIADAETQYQGESQGQGQKSKSTNSEKQIFVILLLVAFSFFVLISPFYAFHMYVEFVGIKESPAAFAEFFLFYQIMHKMYYTNNAINFFLYVISGQKFRKDLINLFTHKKENCLKMSFRNVSDNDT